MSGPLSETAGGAPGRSLSTSSFAEHVRVVARLARPPEERPTHETLDGIAAWLLEAPRQIGDGIATFDELVWRLMAAGMPLLRATFHISTLHPQFLGTTMTWWRDTGESEQVMIAHEIVDTLPQEQNPVWRVCYRRETLRRRLDRPDEFDFAILSELRERGGTDYIALPVSGAYAVAYMLTFVTDRPGGFTDSEIADLTSLAQRLAIVADRHNQWRITLNLLSAYLGASTGPKVLDGQIRRGTGMDLTAILWSSDLRGFTERSDRLSGERMIGILNDLFEAQAAAIRKRGGEILKFIGDGILAIFPIDEPDAAAEIATGAVAAAQEAVAATERLVEQPSMDGEPPLAIVVALHVGTVYYGNIGAADRLDFTVIGPAVNLVSRIETVAKALDQPVAISADLARLLGGGAVSLGRHQLRGLATPHELFAPA